MSDNNEVLLTIAIPTFNRCEYLDQLLNELMNQLHDIQYSIEIVVSDNASVDATEMVVNNYLNKSSNIKIIYYKNKENVGADKNIELLIARSSGRYLWLLCDDDLPSPNAISKIYNLILDKKQLNIALFFINRSIQNLTMTEVFMKREHDIDHDILFDNGKNLFDKFKNSILTASCLILKRDSCLGVKTKKFLTGFYCSPMVLALEALLHGQGYFISSPLVIYREGDKSSWSHLWKTIYFYNIPFIINNLTCLGYSKNTFNEIIQRNINDFMFTDFIYSWKLSDNPEIIDCINWFGLITLYKNVLVKKPKIVLLIFLPSFILRTKSKLGFIKRKISQQLGSSG